MSDETMTNPVATSKFESGKAHALHAAEDLRAAAEAKAQELRAAAEAKAHELKGKAEQLYGTYRTRASTLREEGEHYVRENPMRAVLTALGVGFVLGLIFRR
jgi:ElaB/YqjD/DUF883 family membrane-anchored ribosome-binding protein